MRKEYCMKIKKMLTCVALTVCTLLVLSGCGNSKKGDFEITFKSSIGNVKIEMREGSKYSLKSGKDSFEIVGGSETINGSLMDMDEAESLQADSFESADYNVISVNGKDGFACSKNNKSIHVIPVGDGVYVSLSVDNDAQVIYEAEESIVISDVSVTNSSEDTTKQGTGTLTDDINGTSATTSEPTESVESSETSSVDKAN